MDLSLPYCYFTFGFCLSFPAIATQFLYINELKLSPVSVAVSYSIISLPWILKPIYGYISDQYTILNWGKRRPYIFYTAVTASYMYLTMEKVLHNYFMFTGSLTFISLLLCFSDVCADSITVEIVKGFESHESKGVIQSNNWIARAVGTLTGSFLGGMAAQKLSTGVIFKITSVFPLIMGLLIWRLPKSDVESKGVITKLVQNFKEQKKLAFMLLFISISPSYGTFYVYFLEDKLGYTPADFTWIGMASSTFFLLGTLSYRFYFRKFKIKNTITVAILISVIFRLPQLLVVTGTYQEFWLVLTDGCVESFSNQLIILPLIVFTAQKCNDGVEGSLFALMMSLSNLSNIIAAQLGALTAAMLNVSEDNFDNLKYLVLIAIAGDFIILMITVRKMFFSSSDDYSSLGHTPDLQMIDLGRTQDSLENMDDTTENLAALVKENQGHKSDSSENTRDSLDSSGHRSGSLDSSDHRSGSLENLDHRLCSSGNSGHKPGLLAARMLDMKEKVASLRHHPGAQAIRASSSSVRAAVGSVLKTGSRNQDELTVGEQRLLKTLEETYSDEVEVDIGLTEDIVI